MSGIIIKCQYNKWWPTGHHFLFLLNLYLLDGIPIFRGLHQNGDQEFAAPSFHIPDSTVQRVGTALVHYLKKFRGILREKRLHYLAGLTAAVITASPHHIYLKIIGEPYRKTLGITSGHVLRDRIEHICSPIAVLSRSHQRKNRCYTSYEKKIPHISKSKAIAAKIKPYSLYSGHIRQAASWESRSPRRFQQNPRRQTTPA